MSKWEYVHLCVGIMCALFAIMMDTGWLKLFDAIVAAINLTMFVYWRDKNER